MLRWHLPHMVAVRDVPASLQRRQAYSFVPTKEVLIAPFERHDVGWSMLPETAVIACGIAPVRTGPAL